MAIVTDHSPTFRDGFEDLARRAVQDSLSYEQSLGELAEQECHVRRTNRIECWWGNVIVVDQGRIVPWSRYDQSPGLPLLSRLENLSPDQLNAFRHH
jgi:hypothetical protein